MKTLVLALLCLPLVALAGAQQYEPLAASVRARLSAAIADKAVRKVIVVPNRIVNIVVV